MLSRLKNLVMAAAMVFAFAAPAVVSGMVYAEHSVIHKGLDCGGELKVETGGGCTPPATGVSGLQGVLERGVNIFSIIVGVIAVIMIIVGGLKYITSGGDSGNVSSAKNTIIYAIVGLIIVALAQFIVRFVLGVANDTTT